MLAQGHMFFRITGHGEWEFRGVLKLLRFIES